MRLSGISKVFRHRSLFSSPAFNLSPVSVFNRFIACTGLTSAVVPIVYSRPPHSLLFHTAKPMSAATATATATTVDLKSVDPKSTRIGWVGTGVMGVSMAGHLLKAGYSVSINTRTKARAQSLIDAGAKWCDTPRAVSAESDVVFTMLGFPQDVREVYLTAKDSILSGIRTGSIVVDMTTTEPSLAKEIATEFERVKKVATIDAPVSGGDIGARNATLSIMVGGPKPALERVTPLLQIMGKTIVYQGMAGSGQHTKMCNQIVIASTMVGVCESLIYGSRAGLDVETMLSSISGGAAACWTLSNLAPRVLKRNFDPGFFVEHFVKDMGIALDEAKRMKLALPGLALANQLYVSVMAQGHGKKGTHALALALEHMNSPAPTTASAASAGGAEAAAKK